MLEFTHRRLKGDWMEDGMIRDFVSRECDVAVYSAGSAYIMDDWMRPETRQPVILDADGSLRCWGAGVTFSPDDGELERCGLEPALLPRYRAP